MSIAIVEGTPVEFHEGFAVKREDKCCEAYPLAKIRGIYPHVASRSEAFIGCVDTFRSWNGLGVSMVCSELGKTCVLFYPEAKEAPGLVPPLHARARDEFNAIVVPIKAGRQGIMTGRAKTLAKLVWGDEVYFLPVGLKLPETVAAVAREAAALRGLFDEIVVPTGTGTNLKGVIAGKTGARITAVLGYSQNHERLRRYVNGGEEIEIVDEGYVYRDQILVDVPFPANSYYETKCWLWMRENRRPSTNILLWNIGAD